MTQFVTHQLVTHEDGLQKGIKCLVCGRISWYVEDIKHLFCVGCDLFHDLPACLKAKRIDSLLHSKEWRLYLTPVVIDNARLLLNNYKWKQKHSEKFMQSLKLKIPFYKRIMMWLTSK